MPGEIDCSFYMHVECKLYVSSTVKLANVPSETHVKVGVVIGVVPRGSAT